MSESPKQSKKVNQSEKLGKYKKEVKQILPHPYESTRKTSPKKKQPEKAESNILESLVMQPILVESENINFAQIEPNLTETDVDIKQFRIETLESPEFKWVSNILIEENQQEALNEKKNQCNPLETNVDKFEHNKSQTTSKKGNYGKILPKNNNYGNSKLIEKSISDMYKSQLSENRRSFRTTPKPVPNPRDSEADDVFISSAKKI